MANIVPTVGSFSMFLPPAGGSEDSSLESAIRLTIPIGVRPTRIQNFGALVSNVPNYDLIDSTYGIKGSVPSQSTQFRGYPKPTLDLNYEVVETGTYPNLRWQALWCLPTLNNIVGFDVVITLSIFELQEGNGNTTTPATLTIAKGSTVVTSTTGLDAPTGGKYRLDTAYRQPTNTANISGSIDATVNVSNYFVEDTTYSFNLTYTAATTVYSRTWFDYSQVGCGGTSSGGGFTVYTVASPETGGNTDPRWAVNSKFYTDAALTTLLAAGNYYASDTGGVFYDTYVIGTNGNLDSRVIDCT